MLPTITNMVYKLNVMLWHILKEAYHIQLMMKLTAGIVNILIEIHCCITFNYVTLFQDVNRMCDSYVCKSLTL